MSEVDLYLEELYLKAKYGDDADLELARMYEEEQLRIGTELHKWPYGILR